MRLAEAGELRRIRRGLYWRGRQTRLGMALPPSEELVRELVGAAGVGPAGWSAALALGLSTQHPRREIIAVPSRPPRPLPRIELRDRSGREGRRRWNLNRWEVALLEVLADWQRLIEVPEQEAAARLLSIVDGRRVRPERVARAAAGEPASVRESLRALLARAGYPQQAASVPQARSPGPQQRALPLEAAARAAA